MNIRTFGQTLGLGAVLLSAVLLIAALVGGMTVEEPKTETVMAHAVSSQAEHMVPSGTEVPNHYAGTEVPNHYAGTEVSNHSAGTNGSNRYDDPYSIPQPGHQSVR